MAQLAGLGLRLDISMDDAEPVDESAGLRERQRDLRSTCTARMAAACLQWVKETTRVGG